MKQFSSIEKIDTCILYALELTSSLSVLLLAFGLIASMANVLTKGSVLSDNSTMQQIWAWTQCIAIDANVAGTIIRTYRYYLEGERVKAGLYGFLSALLLFTAAIVSNIESVQQTLNITLDNAYVHTFIPLEVLIWIRSLTIMLLIVAHALRHVQSSPSKQQIPSVPSLQPQPLALTPEHLEKLQMLLDRVTVSEETPIVQTLPAPQTSQEENNFDRVKTYLATHPEASARDIADALSISPTTANKWRNHVNKLNGLAILSSNNSAQ